MVDRREVRVLPNSPVILNVSAG